MAKSSCIKKKKKKEVSRRTTPPIPCTINKKREPENPTCERHSICPSSSRHPLFVRRRRRLFPASLGIGIHGVGVGSGAAGEGGIRRRQLRPRHRPLLPGHRPPALRPRPLRRPRPGQHQALQLHRSPPSSSSPYSFYRFPFAMYGFALRLFVRSLDSLLLKLSGSHLYRCSWFLFEFVAFFFLLTWRSLVDLCVDLGSGF